MEINKSLAGNTLTVKVSGSLDTVTSPDLQAALDNALEGVTVLVFDFSELDYISSAGFRVLLVANKKLMASGGELEVRGANPAVREVFEMTGFADLFKLS